METTETITIEIDGKEYFLVNTISHNNNTYNFFANINNVQDIQILKEDIINNEKYYIPIENDTEFELALSLYYNKTKNEI